MNRQSHRSILGRSQRGAVLLVSMIFLIVLMLIVTSAIRSTNVNTRVVGNMQTQKEAEAAGQQAIEAAISRSELQTLPATQTTPVDINNSGQTGSTYNVIVEPALIACQKLEGKEVAVDFSSSNSDLSMFSGVDSGASGAQVQVWNIRATVQTPGTSQSVAVLNQGVTQRMSAGNCS